MLIGGLHGPVMLWCTFHLIRTAWTWVLDSPYTPILAVASYHPLIYPFPFSFHLCSSNPIGQISNFSLVTSPTPPSTFMLPINVIPTTPGSFQIISQAAPHSATLTIPEPEFDYSFLHQNETFYFSQPTKLRRYLRKGSILAATDGSAFVLEKRFIFYSTRFSQRKTFIF